METKPKFDCYNVAGFWYYNFFKFVNLLPDSYLKKIYQHENPKSLLKHENWSENIKSMIKQNILHFNSELSGYTLEVVHSFCDQLFEVSYPSIQRNQENAKELAEKGFCKFSLNDDKLVNRLNKYIDSLDLHDETNVNPNLVSYKITDLVANIDIMHTLTKDEFLLQAYDYIKTPVIISNLSAWDSLPNRENALQAQLFHVDVDDISFCKGFIYLTDVDKDSGPHTYIPTTNNIDVIKKLAVTGDFEKEDFFRWYLSQLRKTDEECSHFIGINPVEITGPKGTALIVDTSGIHKGKLPTTKPRRIVQALFSATPNIQRNFAPIPFSLLIKGNEHLEDHFSKPHTRYALQLLVDFSS